MYLDALVLQPAGPKAGSADTTATTGAPPPGAPPAAPSGGGWISFLPILMILPVFFLMSRRNKKEAEARGSLKKGDQVASTAGLVGELMEMDERFAKVKIGPGITVKMLASSLMPLDPAPAKKEPEKSEDKADKSDDKPAKSDEKAAKSDDKAAKSDGKSSKPATAAAKS